MKRRNCILIDPNWHLLPLSDICTIQFVEHFMCNIIIFVPFRLLVVTIKKAMPIYINLKHLTQKANNQFQFCFK